MTLDEFIAKLQSIRNENTKDLDVVIAIDNWRSEEVSSIQILSGARHGYQGQTVVELS